jgi:hypothetical protein
VPFAIVAIRAEPWYRKDAIETGLRRLGYTIKEPVRNTGRQFRGGVDHDEPASRDDLLLSWNRKIGHDEQVCDLFEARGGTVLILENGYLQRVDKSMYAISVHGHCGSGWYPYDDDVDRFVPLGFVQKPWRTEGKHVLVCGQRGVGGKVMASPAGWGQRLKINTELALMERGTPTREVRLRSHPGNFVPKIPLEQDLKDAWACVVWSSACGVRALVEGIPVFCDAPAWICRDVAYRPKVLNRNFTTPKFTYDQVRIALNRMAHGQWSVEEIRSGEPFARMRDAGWGPRLERQPGQALGYAAGASLYPRLA